MSLAGRYLHRKDPQLKNVERFSVIVGLLLLVAFFAPYIWKLTQWDITLILLGGVALATWDAISQLK
jgi:hypothetical protein